MIRLFDTATRRLEELDPRDPGRFSMYVCGPTVYDTPHLGHGRFSLVFDVLRRYLEFGGLDVRYVSNITDVDDKIIDRARAEGRSEPEVAAEYEGRWWDAMDALGVKRPTVAPRATEYVDEMVELIAKLVERGAAYETSDGVYLACDQVDGYGLLALQPLESLRAGARVEGSEEKRSPLDFALWKKTKPEGPSWDSPFGPGRPGWHTECVVMSLGLLGEDFDLHGGGQDLRFPHHENERAQAIAAGHRFARRWVHNGFIEVGGEKMSKSLGNFTSLSDLLERADPRSYRLLVLRSHYRSPMEVTPATVADAEAALDRLDAMARRFSLDPVRLDGSDSVRGPSGSVADLDDEAVAAFCAAMDDDLDTPAALAGIFELVTAANAAADAAQAADAPRALMLARTVGALCAVLGLGLRGEKSELDDGTRQLVSERDQARADREWARADALRGELAAMGWVVEDGPEGTRLHRSR